VILRARIILRISAPPIENGVVVIRNDRIVSVGKWNGRKTREPVRDLGEVILLPGLVNAHCHLDYTDISIPRQRSFTRWVQKIIQHKTELDLSDYRKSWLRGARMLEETGTTTVADIEAVPDLLPAMWKQTDLRVVSFLEMTGVAAKRAPKAILDDTLKKASQLKQGRVGLSPHALYSTVPELLKLTAKRNSRITMHVAESEEEMQMYSRRKGELFDWLSRVRDMSDCGGTTPVEAVHRAGLLRPNFLAVHANYLTSNDINLLARSGASVVHCPRSHAYFSHKKFPLNQLAGRNINICLGTDSAASMTAPKTLNIFLEMQQLARTYPALSAVQILRMATINGARALGFPGQIGELRRGAFADVIAVQYGGAIASSAEAVLHSKQATTAHCAVK
jgi:aminodeoxyfutalosine deaminase